MKASPVLQYRNPFWRNKLETTKGISAGWDRAVANLASIEFLEAKLRVNRSKVALEALRKAGYLPGVVVGGKGQFSVPIYIKYTEAQSLHDRGGFDKRDYKLILEGRVQTVRCINVQRHPVSLKPFHFTLRRQAPEEPPLLNKKEQELKEYIQRSMTTHYYNPDEVPTSFPKLWLKEEGGIQ